MKKTIAVTVLNSWSCLKLLCLRDGFTTLLFLKRSAPDWLYGIVRRRFTDSKGIGLDNHPEAYDQSERDLYRTAVTLTENQEFYECVRPCFESFRIPEDHLKISLRKYLIDIMRQDLQLCLLAKMDVGTEGEGEVTSWAEEAKLLNKVNYNGKLFQSSKIIVFDAMTALLKTIIIVIGMIFTWMVNYLVKPPPQRCKIIFRQRYGKRFAYNSEFEGFYQYLRKRDDVGYYCISRDCEIYESVLADKKPVFVTKDLQLPLKTGLTMFVDLTRLCYRLLKPARFYSLSVGASLLDMFRMYATTSACFSTFRPAYYLHIRSEMTQNHPVMTGVAEVFGIRHIGYQMGSTSPFYADIANIDFHHFGVLGRSSINSFYAVTGGRLQSWSVLGPIAVDINYLRERGEQVVRTVVFLATSPMFDLEDKLFKQAFSIVAKELAGKDNIRLILRDKGTNPARRSYAQECSKKSRLDFEYEGSGDSQLFASEVIQKAWIVVVCIHSSTAWDALALGKRLVIFEAAWQRHPLEDCTPNLVVRRQEDFQNLFSWLWNVTDSEYAMAIRPIIEENCKAANGHLVQEFFEDIEKSTVSGAFRNAGELSDENV